MKRAKLYVILSAATALISLAGCTTTEQISSSGLARSNDVTPIRDLVTDPGEALESGNTPLHVAAAEGSREAALILVGLGADVTVTNDTGETPLHRAAASGSPEVTGLLLAAGADPDTADADGATPLHVAVDADHVDVARRLALGGSDVFREDDDGLTPVEGALSNEQMLDAILTAPGVNRRTGAGDPLIVAATRRVLPAVAAQLLEEGADPDLRGSDGERAIELALADPHDAMRVEIAASLIAEGSEPANPDFHYLIEPIRTSSIDRRNDEGETALMQAAAAGHSGVVRLLLQRGADHSLRGVNGDTALHRIRGAGAQRTLAAFVDAGVDLSVVDERGNTALHDAVRRGDRGVAEQLLEEGLSPLLPNVADETPFSLALDATEDMVSLFLEPPVVSARDRRERTLLHHAVIHDAPDAVIEQIVEAGVPVNAQSDSGRTAAHVAAERAVASGSPERMLDLLDEGADILNEDREGLSPLLILARRRPDLLRVVLAHPRAREERTDDEATALHYVVARADAAAVGAALDAGFNPDVRDERRRTPLHVAARLRREAAVELLAEAGADPNARDEEGNTPLHSVARLAAGDTAELLVSAGAELDVRNAQGRTPFLEAVAEADVLSVAYLLSLGADPSVVDSRGESALHAAVAAGSLPKLSLLLRLGVPVDARDVDGETALHRAVRAGANEAAARLIRAGADLFAGNNADVMPIDLAFNRGPVELDEFLTPNRARARSDRGETVLIRAVQTDRSPDIIRVIIEAGAPIEARTARGATALHLAVAMRDPEAIELLLRANASIYVRDNAGESPLLTAVRDGVESLRALDVGGTLAERDAEENTSLHVAAREGSVETVEYLLDRGINPNSRNLVGQTPVDVAREAGNAQIARVLEAAR